MDANRSWQRLRWLRANPPGHAGASKDRRETFTAALEQAEQLVRSAAGQGPESRPINLFYGLSQGARAVAAALDPSDKFRLGSHGIEHVGSLNRSIRDITVQQTETGGGSFTKLAELLRSPGLPEPVELGDLMAALPLRTPVASWSDRPQAVGIEHISQNSGAWLVLTPKVLARTQGWIAMPDLMALPPAERRERLSSYIDKHYPRLAGMEPLPDGHAQLVVGDYSMQLCLQLTAPDSMGSDGLRSQLIELRTVDVMGQRFALPRFGTATEPCHPTVVLWACLWTFSMLARYEPVRWTKTLDIDSCSDATALEEILEDAITLVPWCLLDALSAVPDWSGA